MTNKTNWYLKLISLFYGIRGEMDEYQIQEVNRIGNNAFLVVSVLWPMLIVLSSFLIFLMSAINALLVLIFLSLIAMFGVSYYVILAVGRLHLDEIDSYDENDYHTWVKRTKYRAIFLTITFFLVERILTILLKTVMGESFLGSVLSVKNNLDCLIISILFGVTMYYSMKKKIKKP